MAKKCIGLDIGSGTIKVVQLRESKRGIQLVNFGIEPVPPQSIVDGSVMNASAVSETISSLFSKLRIRQKEVSLAISGHSVIIKKIAVPMMTRDELDDQIHYEAENHIPFSRDDVELDHQILASQPGRNQMEVLLVAAKKEMVLDYTQLVRDVGLSPVVVDVAAFCLQNCFELGYGRAGLESNAVALLNVGASTTTINIVSNGSTAFTRDVTIGGHSFTEEIQKQLNVGYEEAEALKRGGLGSDDVVPQEVEEILGQQAEVMAAEFQRSFDFYLATAADGHIDQIFLAGGSAMVAGLQRALESRARLPVALLDPFAGIGVDESKFDMEYVRAHASMAAIAVGLALRSEGDSL